MSDVTEWIYDFAGEHINRYKTWQNVWPRLKDAQGKVTLEAAAFFAEWAGMFAERGVNFDVARLASAEMSAREPTLHPGKHRDEFIKYVEIIWARKAAEDRTGAAPQTREHAQAASANCPECAGCGYTVRPFWYPQHDREYNMSMFCLCLYGEWLAANFPATGPGSEAAARDMKGRTRRLAQYPELWDRSIERYKGSRWPNCWPLNPVARPWAIESGWRTARYGTDPEVIDIHEGLQTYEDITLRVTGHGPRKLQ